MNVRIHRHDKQLSDKETLGTLTVIDEQGKEVYNCATLELPDKHNESQVSCIPTGVYTVIKRFSPAHGNHFHVKEVPNRSFILIHSANYVSELRGCIAPGLSHKDINKDGLFDVASSVAAMNDLSLLLPDMFKLSIT